MPILVDPTRTFPVRIKYRDIYDTNNDPIAVKILPDDAEGEGVQTFEVQALGRVGDYMSRIMEECTYFNHISGKPVIRMRLFCYAVFRYLFKQWNLCDAESGEMIPMSDQMLMWLDWGITRAIVRKWVRMTGGKL